LLISMMDEKRLDLSVEARRTVERLASAVTTNAALGAPNEPPLITFVRPPPPDSTINKDRPSTRKTGGGPAARGGNTKSPTEAGTTPAADFEP